MKTLLTEKRGIRYVVIVNEVTIGSYHTSDEAYEKAKACGGRVEIQQVEYDAEGKSTKKVFL